MEPAKRALPNLRHRLGSRSDPGPGHLFTLSAVFYGVYCTLRKADDVLNLIEVTPLEDYSEYSRGLLNRVDTDLKASLALAMPPGFFPEAEQFVRDHFVASIRKLLSASLLRQPQDAGGCAGRGHIPSWASHMPAGRTVWAGLCWQMPRNGIRSSTCPRNWPMIM